MPRSLLGTQWDRVLATSKQKGRRSGRRFRAGSLGWVESLEERRLLANIIPSGVISSVPNGANFDYTIAFSNSSASGAGIATFWYAWVPGQDDLATSPIFVTPPTGWTDNITNMGSDDGRAIQYLASSSSDYVRPGARSIFSSPRGQPGVGRRQLGLLPEHASGDVVRLPVGTIQRRRPSIRRQIPVLDRRHAH